MVPLTLAWLLVGKWRPAGQVNHGELLNPARPVFQLRLQRLAGGAVTEAYLHGRWTLVYLGVACDERCKKGLYTLRQVRLALGKDRQRTQTLFIMTGTPEATLLPWLEQEHPQLTAGVADTGTLDFFAHAFPGGVAVPGEWLYLIDPLGNLFMRYRLSDNPKGILTDLQRVLQYSALG
jgi:cytochrome oxidase Cu insertion factor (SCO1/SenC/PrrC family)